MKILLIGCLGQVGREIQELAYKNNFEVIGFDIDKLDITKSVQVTEIITANKNVDFVINAAAYTAVDRAEDELEKAFAINRDGVKFLALACKVNDIPLLHISTDYVFSGVSKNPYREEDITNPLNVYGKSKLAGDLELISVWEKHIILRVSWVFGKYGNNFVKTVLRLAKEKETLNVVGDQFGCPTAAADIARVLLDLTRNIQNGKKFWGIYHYCGYPVTSWYDFAERIVELGKKKYVLKLKHINKITTAEYPTKARRPYNSELFVEKITRDYDIKQDAWIDYLRNVIDQIEL